MSPPVLCVLDVETAPARDAGPRSSRLVPVGGESSDHALVCASVLTVVGDGTGPGGIDIQTVTDRDEGALVAMVDALLPRPDAGGTLVTFNGTHHDLVVLRARAMATWSLAVPSLAGWCAGGGAHRDLMLDLSAGGRARWPSLAAACGALGVPAKVLPPRRRREDAATMLANQCDVVATYLLHLHLEAFEASDPRSLAARWVALADAFGGADAAEHLLPYADHPRLAAARRLLAREAR